MTLPHQLRAYEQWAPVLARIFLAVAFLIGAWFKIPGTESFVGQVGMVAGVGIPFPEIGLFLAFLLELVGGIALLIGWKTRLFAFLFVLYLALITLLFHIMGANLADPMAFGNVISHLNFIAGLIYVSVYGAQNAAVKTCPLPQGLSKM